MPLSGLYRYSVSPVTHMLRSLEWILQKDDIVEDVGNYDLRSQRLAREGQLLGYVVAVHAYFLLKSRSSRKESRRLSKYYTSGLKSRSGHCRPLSSCRSRASQLGFVKRNKAIVQRINAEFQRAEAQRQNL